MTKTVYRFAGYHYRPSDLDETSKQIFYVEAKDRKTAKTYLESMGCFGIENYGSINVNLPEDYK